MLKDPQIAPKGLQMVTYWAKTCWKGVNFSALVWGSSVKHNPQIVGREHIVVSIYFISRQPRFVV